MAMKDFNFKQFMLEKGEWVGLGIALAITLPAFGIGMKNMLASPSSTSIVKTLDDLTRAADSRIQNANPPDEADKAPKEFFTNLVYSRVDPDEYSTPTEWFIPSSIEDTKRRAPDILPPGEFHADYVRGGMRGHILDAAGKRALSVEQKSVVLGREKKSKKLVRLKDQASSMGRYGQPGVPPPGMPSGERGSGMSAGGMAPGGGVGNLSIPSTVWVDIDKVGTSQNVRLAETIYPVRMVVVTGTFPYRQQLEEFRRALKKHALDDLFAMIGTDPPEASWKFLSFAIQRRTFYPDGREKEPWKDYDKELNSKFVGLFARAVDYEREDPDLYKYEGILSKGLVAVRPQLERGQYPKVEIPSIKETITKLDKEALGEDVKRPLSDLARKLKSQGVQIYDIFNPLLTEEEEEAAKMQEAPTQPPAQTTEKKPEKKDTEAESEQLIPDKALVRFIDVTVEPGLVYEYRIKVKMANPNFGQKHLAYADLGKNAQIEAKEWTLIPKVEVPRDIYFYALDDKPLSDRTTVEIHRWIDWLFKDPLDDKTQTPLGDWTIAEKLPVRRGEYIGKFFETKVPLWNTLKEDWEIAINPKNRLDKKLPVDFTVRTARSLDPALLVDYQGGKGVFDRLELRTPESNKPKATQVTDTVPAQLLVLTPEGKLIVHYQQDDSSNEERIARHKAWKDWIADVESGRASRKSKPEESPMDKFRGGGSSN